MQSLDSPRARCANHEGTSALAYCRGCTLALCDPCCVYTINEDVWCEACGGGVEDESRPRYGRGALRLAVGFGLTSGIWFAKIILLPIALPHFFYVLLLGYAGSMFWAWNGVSPVAGIDRPAITRRRPGSAIPRAARRV